MLTPTYPNCSVGILCLSEVFSLKRTDMDLNENGARQRNGLKMKESVVGSDLEVEEKFSSSQTEQQPKSEAVTTRPEASSSLSLLTTQMMEELACRARRTFSSLSSPLIGLIILGLCGGLLLMNTRHNTGKELLKHQEEINDLEGRTIDNEQELNVLKSRLEVLEYEIFEARKFAKENHHHHHPQHHPPNQAMNNDDYQKSTGEADKKLAMDLANMKRENGELVGRYEKELSDWKKKVTEKDEQLKKLKVQVGGLERQIKSNKVELLRKTKQNKLLRDEHEKEVAQLKEDRLTFAMGYLAEKQENEDVTNDFINTYNLYRRERGDTDLHIAAFFKEEARVKKLIEEGYDDDLDIDVNARNKELQTPLHRAAMGSTKKKEALPVLKYLIGNGADVYMKDENNRTFLHELLDNSTSLSPPDLHEFCEYLIIEKGFTNLFDIRDGFHGSTPLHLAVRQIEVEERTLALLYKNGVNFNAVNDKGNILLVYAIEGRRTARFLTGLMKYGRDWSWSHLNHNNQSLIYIASQFNNVDAISFILAKGGPEVDINGVDRFGDTPLHGALLGSKDVFNTVLFLLQNGAEPNLRNKDGYVPLSYALARTDLEDQDRIVALLRNNM